MDLIDWFHPVELVGGWWPAVQCRVVDGVKV